jgi:hypothetical protein
MITLDNASRRVLTNLALGSEQVKQGLRRGAYISGKQMTDFLKKEMTKKGRSGRKYLIYKGLGGRLLKKPRLHIASSPSEYPAVISGEFRKSIDFLVQGYRTLTFGSGANGLAKRYAKILEEGSSKMAARKPVERTHNQFKEKIKINITKEVNKQLKIK